MMSPPDVPPIVGPPPYPPDPVVDAYKPGVDRTLIVENLRRTPTERLTNLAALQRFVERFRGAAWPPEPADRP